MKKTDRNANGDMCPDYDFAAMKGGVRAKYLKRLRERTGLANKALDSPTPRRHKKADPPVDPIPEKLFEGS